MTDPDHLTTLQEMANRWEADLAKLSKEHNQFSRDSLDIAIRDLRVEIKDLESEKAA